MTIRGKVQLGFAVILAMFVGLSGFALNQMTIMSHHFTGITERVIPTLGLSAEMSLVLDKLRVTQAYHVLEQSKDKMSVLQLDVEKLQARMYKLQREYRELATDPAQQTALDALATDFKTYVTSFDSLRVVSAENRTDEALRLLRQSAPIHAKLLARIADLDDLTRDLADKAGAAGQEAADDATTGAIAAVVGLALILLALVVLSNRDILMPMRRLIGAIDQLAEGDLASEIPLAARRDELGDVARALQHFRANAIEKERLQRQENEDLAFARRIQLASVPRHFPAFPERREFDVCGRLAPTRAIGGDFFDFYLMDQDRLVIAIGDASGKGVASAMFVGLARSALKSEGVKTPEPEMCLSEANRTLAVDNESMMFMTTFYGVLDLRTGELAYANAGHTPPLLLRRDRGVQELPAEPGLPLGIVEDFKFAPHRYRFAPGEAIVLYTDGVTEAADLDGTFFGQERLEELLASCPPGDCEAVVEEVFNGVVRFSRGAPQSDDIAVLVVRYNGVAVQTGRSVDAPSRVQTP
jgi:serine phosphatase RsbU (regulator of sigma subunit)